MRYRPEIDGLRTIAVVSVIIYHLKITLAGDVQLLGGGYLGVDVFFVLSGFLITRILLADVAANGRVSYGTFYTRRARRILPPLLLVMLASLPAAWIILLPSQMVEFAQSLPAALFFVANGFWYGAQHAYGAESALLKPFLHTWSLAVEEQFYIVLPVALMLFHRWRIVGAGLLAGLVLGFILAVATTELRFNLSFYSPTSRAWELLAGGCLAWLAETRGGQAVPDRWAERLRWVPSASLVAVLLSLVFLSRDSAAGAMHPGLSTLPVVLGTCAMIAFARPEDPVTRLLSTAPFVWIGKLSYSLYLWHFPIFAFGRLTTWDPGPLDWAAWTALTVACSWIGYKLVEVPFRHSLPARPFALLTGGAAAAAMLFAGAMVATDGLRSRQAELLALYGPAEPDNQRLRAESWALLDSLPPFDSPDFRYLGAGDPQTAKRALIIGNSHAKDMFNALLANQDALPDWRFARFGVENDLPPGRMARLTGSEAWAKADVVLVAPLHETPLSPRLETFIETARAAGKEVILAGNNAMFPGYRDLPLFDAAMRRGDAPFDADALRRQAYALELRAASAPINAALRALAEKTGARYVDRRTLICNDAAQLCDIVTPDGRKVLFDYGHWSLPGAAFLGARIVEAGWLPGTGAEAGR
ncbi:acyltransferase family protein [Rhodovulum sp. DZ06]|uniref:acyltransferase family protein n=1 Tax=Rhodovulum sp. DZ06 TaxID=3425126 RepID=UPI003D34C956